MKIVTCAALVIFAALTVLLGLQKKDLAAKNSELEASQYYPKKSDWTPYIATQDIAGKPITIGAGTGKREVIFLFTTQCKFCIASMPFVAEIGRSLSRSGIQMVGVTPEKDAASIRRFMGKYSAEFPVVSLSDERQLGLLQFRMSPTVLVINGSGKVEFAKVGVIRSDKEAFEIVSAALQRDTKPAEPARQES